MSRASSPASAGDSESVISELSDLADGLSLNDSANVLETALTKLLDRRAATRMESFEIFNRQLALQLHEEFLLRELAAIQSGLLSSLKRHIPEEIAQSCQMIELIVITTGSKADRLLSEVVPLLKTISRHGVGQAVPAAIRALGTIQLIVCHHTDELHHWMENFARFFRRRDAAIASTAIDAWTLIANRLTYNDLASHIHRAYFRRLAPLLHSQAVDVRMSAGEALALLFEAVWKRRQSLDDGHESIDADITEDDSEAGKDDKFSEASDSAIDDDDETAAAKNYLDDSSLESADEDVDADDLHELLSQLATDGTRSRARKERSLQRSVFRSVEATIRYGTSPKITLKIGKERLTFGTWKSILRLSAMRDVLAQGFYRHVSSNDRIRELLLIPKGKMDSGLTQQQSQSDSVSVKNKEMSQANTKKRQQKLKADRSQKLSVRYGNH